MITTSIPEFYLRAATPADVPLIRSFIRELAEYEKLLDECLVTEEQLQEHLFGTKTAAEVFLAFEGEKPVGFCLFFINFSTFLGKPGIYLEDLFVRPEFRNKGYGKVILSFLAKLALERDYGRFEWSVLDWNAPSIAFYRKMGAVPMDEWTVQRVSGDRLRELADQF